MMSTIEGVAWTVALVLILWGVGAEVYKSYKQDKQAQIADYAHKLNLYIAKANTVFNFPIPRLICANGFTLSIQASKYSYCTPRSNSGPYSEVEVGFPSKKIRAFKK